MKKNILLVISLLILITISIGCEKKEQNINTNTTQQEENNNTKDTKSETEKDYNDYAKEEVLEELKEMYGDKTDDIVIENFKVFTDKELKNDVLKKYTDDGKIVFEVSYKLIAKENIDKNELIDGNGEVDGNWIINKYNIGLLSNTAKGTLYVYSIGTGW